METKIVIGSLDELPEASARLLEDLGRHAVLTFSGELGAGKTTLIQSICRNLGVEMDVNSPTFALVNEYYAPGGESVFHIDLYRIEDPEELFDLGYEEYLYSGSRCFIEWPEKASHLLPPESKEVRIEVREDGARIVRYEKDAG